MDINLMRNILTKIFIKLIDISFLEKKLFESRKTQLIDACQKQVTLGSESKFYPEARVYNLQSKEDSIIIGERTHIRGELLVFKHSGHISIGNDCYIGEGTRIWSGESLTIGNNVLISHNVSIVDTNSHEISFKERAERYKELIKNGHWNDKGSIITSPVIIKDDAWISFNVSILKGVTIGKGAIVAAGSVVTKDVNDFEVVAGNPAKVIKKLDKLMFE